MNWPHIHLLLNHGPIVGSLAAWCLLAGGLLWRSQALIRAALAAFAIVGLLAFVVVETGERADDVVEEMQGVSEQAIEEHEEAAEAAALALEALGALSLIGLAVYRPPRRMPAWLAIALLVAALAPIALVTRAADKGGHILHEEIVGEPLF